MSPPLSQDNITLFIRNFLILWDVFFKKKSLFLGQNAKLIPYAGPYSPCVLTSLSPPGLSHMSMFSLKFHV